MTNFSLEKILKKRSNSEYPTRISCQIKNTLSHPAQGNISVPVNVPIDDSLIWRSDIGQWNWVFAHSYSDCSHYAPLYPRPITTVQCDANPLRLCSPIRSRGHQPQTQPEHLPVTTVSYSTQLYDMVVRFCTIRFLWHGKENGGTIRDHPF